MAMWLDAARRWRGEAGAAEAGGDRV